MSKESGNNGADKELEEELVIIETDDNGKPLPSAKDGAANDDPDDKDQDDDADDPDHEDERVGHAEGEEDEHARRAGETDDEKRERRRRENKAKRIRNQAAARAKDRIITQYGQTLLTMSEEIAQLKGQSIVHDANRLQQQLQTIEGQQVEAKAVMAQLIKAQDGGGVADVTELQIQLREQHRYVTEQLNRTKVAAARVKAGEGDGRGASNPNKGGQPEPNPEIKSRAKEWARKNSWYNPNTGDKEEAALVRAIDGVLEEEGFDPTTDEYWDELTERVKHRLPHHFKKPAARSASDDTRRSSGARNSKGPQMTQASQTGGRRPLGRTEVRISPERKKAMIAAGAWDDPDKRNRMLASYARYDKDNAAARS